MGNSKSKKVYEKPGKNATMFEREKYYEQFRENKSKKITAVKRNALKEPSPIATPPITPVSIPSAAPTNLRSFDDEAIERMRYQLQNDCDAFLLNNILLSVQFFENFER